MYVKNQSAPHSVSSEKMQIFDQNTFATQFATDIRSAKLEVLIQSAFLTLKGLSRFKKVLTMAISRGVHVCLFVQQPQGLGHHNDLFDPEQLAKLEQFSANFKFAQGLGIHIEARTLIHEKIAVIDREFFWDGSLNILSYDPQYSTERMTRHQDIELAKDAIARHRLVPCSVCKSEFVARGDQIIPIGMNLQADSAEIAALITFMRKESKLDQIELAHRLGISRTALQLYERGVRVPRTDLFVHICRVLGYDVVPLPCDSDKFERLKQILLVRGER